jgi:stage IV sporulation protein FB
MVIVSGKLKISAAALAVLLAVFFLDAALLVWVLAAAAAHECGHALALLIFRARVAELRVEPWGFEMTVEGPLSYGKEIAAAAAGPAASLLFAALLSAAGRFFALPGLYFASGVSLVFCIFNALPVPPLDGGRILYDALALRFGPFAADRAVCITSCAVIFALLTAGAALLVATRVNFTLLLAAAWLLISYCKNSGIKVKLNTRKK